MKITKQYIAGFVDGEGYFGIVRKTHKECIDGFYYTPVLKITQVTKNDEVLKKIKEFIGYGNFSFDKRNINPNGADKSNLEIRGITRVLPVAKVLLPELIVKAKQAQTVIDFCEIDKANLTRQELSDKREKLYHQIKLLNRRGPVETKREGTPQV